MSKPAIPDLSYFFEKPLLGNPRISRDNMKKFSEEHLGRLTTNNPGGTLDIILTPMAAVHLAYFGAIADEATAEAVRTGMTRAVDMKIAEFKALVKKREPQIRATFIDDEPTYLQFYPAGLTEYTTADKGNIETLMKRYVNAFNASPGGQALGLHDAFNMLLTGYQSLRKAQVGKKGEVSDDEDATQEKLDAVAIQLWNNLHYLAWYYKGNVQQCMAYFDQSMLRQGANSDGGGDTPAAQ